MPKLSTAAKNDGTAPSWTHQHRLMSVGCRDFNPPKVLTVHTRPPSSWPKEVSYLPRSHISTSLSIDHHKALQTRSTTPAMSLIVPGPVVFSPTPNPLVEIRAIRNPKHPAFGQSGLFAARHLPPGTHITDYTGYLHTCPDPDGDCSTSDYDLAFLDRDLGLAIDGSKMGNEGRFVNDYHGILEQEEVIGSEAEPDFTFGRHNLKAGKGWKDKSCSQSKKPAASTRQRSNSSKSKTVSKAKAGPNAVFEEYFVKARSRAGKEVWEARMGIWVSPQAATGIAKGAEICVSYGRGYWRARAREVLEGEFALVDSGMSNEEVKDEYT